MLSRLGLGSAHRKARGMAGGVAGVIFGLYMMVKVDTKTFLWGYGSEGLAFLFYLLELLHLVNVNYKASDPLSWSNQNRKNEEKDTTTFLLAKFNAPGNAEVVDSLLDTVLGEEQALVVKGDLLAEDDDQRYAALCQVFAAVHNDFTKYPHAFVFSMFCFFGHLVEMNLTQFALTPDKFDFTNGGLDNDSNKGLVAVMLFAAYHCMMAFKEVKASYEMPESPYALKLELMNAFTSHQRQLEVKHEAAPADSVNNTDLTTVLIKQP